MSEVGAVVCPQCGGKRFYRDGWRYLSSGEAVQRFLCRDCGLRFSLEKLVSSRNNTLKGVRRHSKNSQLGAILEEAKKLDSATETKTVAGEVDKTQQEVKGKIIQYAITLQNKGKTKETIRTYTGALYTLINKGANLLSPQSVEET